MLILVKLIIMLSIKQRYYKHMALSCHFCCNIQIPLSARNPFVVIRDMEQPLCAYKPEWGHWEWIIVSIKQSQSIMLALCKCS